MSVIARFNDLNNRDSTRKEIESLLVDAKAENNTEIVFRLSKVLNTFPDKELFRLTIKEYKEAGLKGAQHSGDFKEALDDCGRLKKGYKFHFGKIIKIEAKVVREVVNKETPVTPTTSVKKIVSNVQKKTKEITKKPTPVKTVLNKVSNVQKKTKENAKVKKAASKKVEKPVAPTSFANKPKSVAITTAIKDVLTLPKFKGEKPLPATIFYKLFKNFSLLENEDYTETNSEFEFNILDNSNSKFFICWACDNSIEINDFGIEFVEAVKGRLESLHNQKHNYALFDGLKGTKATPVKKSVSSNKKIDETILEKTKPVATNKNSLAYKMANKPVVADYFTIANKPISEFLGKVERKTKESVFISLTGGQGSMKTRMCFQFMNALAQNYKVGHASIEEHPESVLYFDKAKQYLNDKALNNIESPEITNLQELHALVERNDVIVIDSYTKMQEMVKGFEVDKDLRKKYNGKLFIVIFQQTTDGKMRGGSKSQFDADIVLFTKKEADYRDNYIYADKNRYQDKPLDGLHFNIFNGKLVTENSDITTADGIENTLEQINKLLSFNVS